MISRASRVAWRASSASLRASAAAVAGSRSMWRASASAAKPMPETVLASESCMSRARRARSDCEASSDSVAAWRSSRPRSPAPAAAISGYSAGSTRLAAPSSRTETIQA